MKFFIYIPVDHISPEGEFQTSTAVREMAEAIERSRAHGAFVTEHPAPSAHWLHNDPTSHDALDPFTALAFVAATATRLKLLSSAVILPFRNPFITAKAAATLQVLSDNRFTMGVGVGYQKEEFDAVGAAYHKRGALTDEALETIRLAWAGGAVVKQGMFFNAVGNEPRPAPSTPPPIWIGGATDKALERAARWGDGWMPYFTPATNDATVSRSSVTSMQDLADKIEQIRDQRFALGRPAAFDVSVGPHSHAQAATPAEADRVAYFARDIGNAGATSMWTTVPAPSRAAFLENLAWLDEEVMRRFD